MTAYDDTGDMELEADLMALIEHRSKEVEHLRKRLAYSQSKLHECEKKLEETKSELVRLQSRGCVLAGGENSIQVKEERSTSPLKMYKQKHPDKCHGNSSKQEEEEEEDCKIIKTVRKPLLVIPALNTKTFPRSKLCESGKVAETFGKSLVKEKGFVLLPTHEIAASGTKRKFEEDVKKDLIQIVGSCSSACKINCETSNYIPSRHMRKLRNLVLCPSNDRLFVTSALDGVVNLWQIQGRGSNVDHVSSINGASLKQRRWAEDVAWHPRGGSLISVYIADCGESQLAILNLKKGQEGKEVIYLEDKPHFKGIINNVTFMPWGDNCFVTCGSDHAVVHWESDNNHDYSWKPQVLHTNIHSSAVMGAAGMQQKQIVLSVGADKKIVGFDLGADKADYKHQIDSKCMSIVPNPCDQNLFMVQTGSAQRQLRLFDMRVERRIIQEFGWEQENSTSQSALIKQAWSPDGLYLTSGSADPTIHIFDIRFNTNHPSHSIKAHHKRVFKAAWHPSFPILISISSDLNIGLHNITH